MKFLTSLFLLFFFLCTQTNAQKSSFRIEDFSPYDKVVPGQIIEVRVAGLSESETMTAEPKEFKVELNQDSTKLQAKARTAVSTFVSSSGPGEVVKDPTDFSKMLPLCSIGFVIPHGLHPGQVDVVVSYRKQRSRPVTLTIVERPETPLVGITTLQIGPAEPMSGGPAIHGLRLERGGTAQLHVEPLVDSEDPLAAVLISFKQGETSYEAVARVRHDAPEVQQMEQGVMFTRDRDSLEVQIPAALGAGQAQMEVRVRANGQISDANTMTVLISDVNRVAELPADNAPRALGVNPQRVGAGQALTISVDHARTLKPDPAKVLVMFEQGGARYTVAPEINSATFQPSQNDDLPVILVVRPTRQIIGKAQVRVFNSSRGEQGGLGAPTPIEIVDEVFPPELISAAESTADDLESLRQMYEMQRAQGRDFAEYNSANRYLSIRVRGLDINPEHIRLTLEQEGRTKTLGNGDFSSMNRDLFIVRLPKGFHKGQLRLSIQNEGAERFSKPATLTFELSK